MTAYIPLTNTDFAIIDLEDAPKVLEISKSWRMHSGYAYSNKRQFMHHIILGLKPDHKTFRADHEDRDKLNNRKSNLRVVTAQHNNYNTCRPLGSSGFKGVRPYRGRYQAIMSVDNIQIYLGTFDDPFLAALAYDRSLSEWAGAFGTHNF